MQEFPLLPDVRKLFAVGIWLALVAGFLLNGCARNEESNSARSEPAVPDAVVDPAFASALFTNPSQITNPYFPLTPGKTRVFLSVTEDGVEVTVLEVPSTSRVVAGVACRVMRDRVYLDDVLIEDTEDWFAQDDAGNVWYMGEDVDNYHYDANGVLINVTHEGSWEAGLDTAGIGSVAVAGIAMKATFVAGDSYAQENYGNQAEDVARIEALNVPITLENGVTYQCLKTRDWNPAVGDSHEYKYYASGVGLVYEHPVGEPESTSLVGTFLVGPTQVPNFGAAVFTNPTNVTNPFFPLVPGESRTYTKATDEGLETITIAVPTTTRVVNGVTCRIVRDTVYLGSVLIEDTDDWYAQDDAGNVWYMGEAVQNYNYNAMGVLVNITNEGSWEAGVAGAQPGYNMLSSNAPGQSYYQEYAATIAEDVAMVVRLDATVVLSGTTYTNCLQTLEWAPLSPGQVEYKFYAPTVGLVHEIRPLAPEVEEDSQQGGCSAQDEKDTPSLLIMLGLLLAAGFAVRRFAATVRSS